MSRARDLANFASDSQINAGEIEDNAVTTAKIADNAITVAKIGDGAVHNVKLANSTIIMSGDSGSDSVALGETMTVAGGTGLTSTGSSNTITISLDNTAVTAGSYGSSTAIPTFTVDAQGRLTAASTTAISSDMSIAGDSGTDTITVGTDTFTIAGGTGLTSTATTDTITLNIDSTVATLTGSQTLTNKTINSASNTITITESNISDLGAYLENVSEDTTPQLGGNLDLNSNDITGTGNINITGNATFSGNLTINGTTTTVNSTTIEITNSFTFEGATADGFETVLGVVDPTADRTINLPDATGTVVLKDTTDTLTNKTINSASNTITITESNISDLGSYIENVVEDTTPQLGGDLSTNGNDINFGDNDKAVFGAGSDLQIYHDGINSYVQDVGVGSLLLRGTNLSLQANNGENFINCTENGSVLIRHNNFGKLATTSTGVDVTGTVTASTGVEVEIGVGSMPAVTGSGHIVRTDGTGSAPFNQAGSLLYLPRQNDTDGRSNHYFYTGATPKLRQNIAPNGDISFYEDTGTTAKFFWDASAERLGIGTSSPSSKLDVNGTVTATAFSGDGSALTGVGTTWESKSANFTAASGTAYFVDTTSGAITATLPASPSTGDEIRFLDVAGTFDTNNLTVARNGNPIQGDASNMTVSTERAGFALVYYNATQGWLLKDR